MTVDAAAMLARMTGTLAKVRGEVPATGLLPRKWDEEKHPRAPDGKFGSGLGDGDGDAPLTGDAVSDAVPHSGEARWVGTYQLLGNSINRTLRESGTTRYTEDLADMDAAFNDAAPLEQPVTTYRGVGGWRGANEIFGTDDATGKRFTDAGFMSTAIDTAPVDAYGGFQAIVEITTPKGGKALALDGQNMGGAVAGEVLLPRGSTMRVTSDMTKDDGQRVIAVEIEVP